MKAWDPRPLRAYYDWLSGGHPSESDLSWFAPYIPVFSTALCEAILEAEGRPARDLPALRKLLSEPTVFEGGRVMGFYRTAEAHEKAQRERAKREFQEYVLLGYSLMRDEASKQAMMARNPDPLDALRREKIMHARPFPGIASLVREAFGSKQSGKLDPSLCYQANDLPREETGIIGNNTLPLSEELRAEVHQFYQESMTHARESGSLSYALNHAP